MRYITKRRQVEAATQSLRPTHQTEDKVGNGTEIATMGQYARLTTSECLTLYRGLVSEFNQEREPEKQLLNPMSSKCSVRKCPQRRTTICFQNILFFYDFANLIGDDATHDNLLLQM
jgi:hypothetical protein